MTYYLILSGYYHRWHVPIKVMVHGVVENWYYAPYYNPMHVPVPLDYYPLLYPSE